MKKAKHIFQRFLWHISNTRLIYSIYVNFRYLPIKQAIWLPLHFHKKSKIINKGKITVKTNNLKLFAIQIGDCNKNFCHIHTHTIIRVFGSIELHEGVDIQKGVLITVTPSGSLILREKSQICSNTKIVCSNHIEIGSYTQVSHESQIFDTDFHFIKNNSRMHINPISSKIIIGNNCWIGNRVTINKGTILADNTIVCSNSLLNKNYYLSGEYNLLGGIPAKTIEKNMERIWNREEELFLLEMNKITLI